MSKILNFQIHMSDEVPLEFSDQIKDMIHSLIATDCPCGGKDCYITLVHSFYGKKETASVQPLWDIIPVGETIEITQESMS